MLMLFISVAAVVGFVAVLTLLAVAHLVERRQAKKGSTAPEPLFAGLSYEQAFDDDYGLIWQTQIPALQLIRISGAHGVSLTALRPWFLRTANCYPDLFDGHTFEEWVEFLRFSRVVRYDREAERLVLTAIGYELLDHCRMAG